MLSEKSPTEQLDDNNQKIFQNFFEMFLYYAIEIDPTMLMVLKSLAAVQTNPAIKNAKQITQFLNYSTTNPDAVTGYIRSGIILHIYLDASHISEPEARSIACGYFFLGPKSNTPIQSMPPKNGPVHV